jgi:hypothetical protein
MRTWKCSWSRWNWGSFCGCHCQYVFVLISVMAVTTRARFCRLSFVRFPSYIGRVVRNNRTKTCGRGRGVKREISLRLFVRRHIILLEMKWSRDVCAIIWSKSMRFLNFHNDLCIEIFSDDQSRVSRVYIFVYGILMALTVPCAL